MSTRSKQHNSGDFTARAVGKFYHQRLQVYLQDVLNELTQRLDVRLVRTFVGLLLPMLGLRHRQNGLLLTEPGQRQRAPSAFPTSCAVPCGVITCSATASGSTRAATRGLATNRPDRTDAVGRKRGRKARNAAQCRPVCRPQQPGPTAEARPARLLQPTRWPTGLCARPGMGRTAGGGPASDALPGRV